MELDQSGFFAEQLPSDHHNISADEEMKMKIHRSVSTGSRTPLHFHLQPNCIMSCDRSMNLDDPPEMTDGQQRNTVVHPYYTSRTSSTYVEHTSITKHVTPLLSTSNIYQQALQTHRRRT